ncbi:MAG: ATP-binding protein [Candidatus Rhabdochlamydia sp.]
MIKELLSEEILEDVKDYILNPHGFMVFAGKNGRGKSYVAMKIYEKLTPYKLPYHDHDLAWFINQADLNLKFTEANEIYGSSMGLLKEAYNTKFLVIDDFGTRTPSPAFMDFLYAIIDRRWNERNSVGTIITTNLSPEKIRKDFGDPIFSRIASGRNYLFKGPERRFGGLGF